MMLTARWLLDHHPDPSPEQIRAAISGQICRCTGYENIVRSIQWAAKHADCAPDAPDAPGSDSNASDKTASGDGEVPA
jgi:aerobic carbon-monoxide dehydrogenase small subunit